MRRFLRASLTGHGFQLIETSTAREGETLAATNSPDLILLDLGLPDGDGIDLVKKLRQWCKVPILVVSARGRESDKVVALDAGADDYLTKPFGVGELLARIRVAFRHADAEKNARPEPSIQIANVVIDVPRREVKVDGQVVHLTPIEYKLLVLLAKHAGKVLTHRQILQEVWGPAYAGQTHYVRVHMAELRKKIEKDPAQPKLLITEPAVGYRLKDDVFDSTEPAQ
ncbi:MAG: winged helix-turn-helix domain-containing protein [Polyangiaceae bacterium]|nr:winged helix-turn-helix domain-containing protein [Polyangiaceae bacterium]